MVSKLGKKGYNILTDPNRLNMINIKMIIPKYNEEESKLKNLLNDLNGRVSMLDKNNRYKKWIQRKNGI